MVDGYSFTDLVKRCGVLGLKSPKRYQNALKELNYLRNKIYHSDFADEYLAIEYVLGWKIIEFFNHFLPELGYSILDLLPFKDKDLYDEIIDYAKVMKEHRKDAPLPIIRLNRHTVIAMMNWLHVTRGRKEEPIGLTLEIMNLKHKHLCESGIEVPCPVCKNMMVFGFAYHDGNGEDYDSFADADYAECAYCGLWLFQDFVVPFFQRFGYDQFTLGEEAERKFKLDEEMGEAET